MAHILEIKNGNKTLEIKTDNDIIATDITVFEFLSSLEILHQKVNLDTFKVERITFPSISFSYEFRSKDGRIWNQNVKNNPSNTDDPLMTFDCPQYWSLSEFILHRPVRDSTIRLDNRYGIEKIEVTFY